MNKTVFFKTFRRLFGFVLAISLSASVLTAQAQNARITLNLSDVPMSQVMKEIEKQTRYLFINKGVDTGKKLSVNLTQKTIQEVLDYVLKNTDITYKIDGTYIILAEKAAEKPVADLSRHRGVRRGQRHDRRHEYGYGRNFLASGTPPRGYGPTGG